MKLRPWKKAGRLALATGRDFGECLVYFSGAAFRRLLNRAASLKRMNRRRVRIYT